MENIENRVMDIVAQQLGIARGEIAPESNLQDDLGSDSLDGVDIVMEIEEEFDIDISDDEAEAVRTVQDIINLVKEKTAS